MLDNINYSFASVFLIEACLKLFALGPKHYFSDKGNAFDFTIVFFSIISSIISLEFRVDFGASTTFIRALRISRIF